MSMKDRYMIDESPRWGAILRDGIILLAALIFLTKLWPFYSVPTGSRGVVTQFGKIVGIEQEGLAVLPPWQNLTLFSIRAEEANIDNASGSTSDTQPVSVSLTVRYSISPDKVSEVYEKYSHNGDLSSYVQTATHEIFKAVTAKYSAPRSHRRARQSIRRYQRRRWAANSRSTARKSSTSTCATSRSQESYMRAINSKVEQEQLRLAAENKLRTVEAEQKQKVAIARSRGRSRSKPPPTATPTPISKSPRHKPKHSASKTAHWRKARTCWNCAASRSSKPRRSDGTASCRRMSMRGRPFRF